MPGHKFTAAERAKAVATRLKNAADRKLKAQVQATGTATTEGTASNSQPPQHLIGADLATEEGARKMRKAQNEDAARHAQVEKEVLANITRTMPFDWHESPLQQAVERLNDLKREYDRAAQIVLSRQSRVPVIYKCWSQEHKELVPRNALAQCRHTLPDIGKAVFIDNGYKDKDGNIRTICCCSMLCYMAYQQSKPLAALSRH